MINTIYLYYARIENSTKKIIFLKNIILFRNNQLKNEK